MRPLRQTVLFSAALRIGLPYRFILLLFSAALFTGCSRIAVPSLQGFRQAPAGDAAPLLAQVRAAADSVKTGRGEYELRLAKGLGKQTLHQVVAFQRPDKLRLELFASALHQLILFAVSREGTLECLDPKSGVLYRGASTPENLSRVIGVPLVAEEAMLWFAGALALPEDSKFERALEVLRKGQTNAFVVRGEISADRCATAHFDGLPSGPRMKSLELRRCGSGKLFFFSVFEYGAEQEPLRIAFQFPEQGLSGTLTRERFILNPPLPAEKLFVIHQPAQTKVEDLDRAVFR